VGRSSPYTPEFREEAVQIVMQLGKTIAETARDLNINPETLRNWVRAYERQHGEASAANKEPLPVDERARLRELERRNRELEMENSFLKKAAAYFAKDSQ